MEFSVKSGTPEKQRSGCLIAGVFEVAQTLGRGRPD